MPEPTFTSITMQQTEDGKRISLTDLVELLAGLRPDAGPEHPLMLVAFALDMVALPQVIEALVSMRSTMGGVRPTEDYLSLDSVIQFLKDAEADTAPTVDPNMN